MKIQDFSGGYNNRIAPHLLQSSEAQEYVNIEPKSGILKPIRGLSKIETNAIGNYFTYYNATNKFVYFNEPTTSVEYKDILYYTNSTGTFKYANRIINNLGIEAPIDKLTVADHDYGPLNGTYRYIYTYYNDIDGSESYQSDFSDEITVTKRRIRVTGFVVPTDPQVTHIRLYRIGGLSTQPTLVIQLGLTETEYIDGTYDISGNEIYDDANNYTPPVGLQYLSLGYAMLFGAVKDKLYYSEIAAPDSWPPTYFIDFDDDITGIGFIQPGIIVFTKYTTYLITGNSHESFSKYIISTDVGCISHYSIQSIDNTLIWVSLDGICMTTGGTIENISNQKLDSDKELIIRNAAVHNKVYYLLMDNKILAIDFRYTMLVRDISISGTQLYSINNTLYITKDNTLYSLFNGDKLEYRYKSPIYTEGEYSNRKIYKDIYIQYEGDIEIYIYIDRKEVYNNTLKGFGTHNIKTLNSKEGYGLEFLIIGTGVVNEISYNVQGREK